MEKVPDGVARVVVGADPPQGMERRLVLRLLGYWRDLPREQDLPSFTAIDPEQIPEMWGHSFVLETVGNEADPLFRAVGDKIADSHEESPVGKHVSQTPANTLASMATGYFAEVLAKGIPVSRGGEFIRENGNNVFYRSILLPMSDDGETISGLLGAANCREVEPD
jgi:hypothetical protein